jgi:WD40 repeat protein
MNSVRNLGVAGVIVVIGLLAFSVLSLPGQERLAENAPALKVEGSPRTLAIAPNGKVIACDLLLRDVATGKELAKGEVGKGDPIQTTYVTFAPDGKRLASVHYDVGLIQARHAICLWDVATDNKLRLAATLHFERDQRSDYRESLFYLTFSQDGRLLATRQPDDATVVWDTANGKEKLRLDTRGLVVAFGADGKTLTSVSRDGEVQHWNLATNECTDPKEGGKRTDFLFVTDALASGDGGTVALTDGHSVLIKDAVSGKTLRRFDDMDKVGAFALTADGKLFAVTAHGVVTFFDVRTGKESARLKVSDKAVGLLTLSPDGKSLAVASGESVSVWDIDNVPQAPKEEVKRDTPAVPLEAKITSRTDTYTLDLVGKTPEEFARLVKQATLPPPPKVDLVLTLRNTGKKNLILEPEEIMIYLHLTGDGAMNHPMQPYQTAADFRERKKITLAPGEHYSVSIKSLDLGHCQQSYWLLPGEYTLHVTGWVWMKPAPEEDKVLEDGSGFGRFRVAPLRLKVVAEKK